MLTTLVWHLLTTVGCVQLEAVRNERLLARVAKSAKWKVCLGSTEFFYRLCDATTDKSLASFTLF